MVVVDVDKGFRREFAGDLARRVAAHAVAHEEDLAARGERPGILGHVVFELVLVVLPHPAEISLAGDSDAGIKTQLGGGRDLVS